MNLRNFFLGLSLAGMFFQNALSAEAFGRPGVGPVWSSAKKVQVGTFYENEKKSLVWFTSSEGVLTEVYYPTIDSAQIKDSQILISDGRDYFAEEKKDLIHEVKVIDPSTAVIVNKDHRNRFEISHTYFTLENSSVLVDEVKVKVNVDGLDFYLLTNPHIKNTGYGDSAYTTNTGFRFEEGEVGVNIESSVGFTKTSVGFVGKSDGYQDLVYDKKMDFSFSSAKHGNVASLGKINIPAKVGEYTFQIIYKFSKHGKVPHISSNDLKNGKSNYINSWNDYLKSMKTPRELGSREKLLYKRSLYTLKTHEDKLNPGAFIASLSIPWGNQQVEHEGDAHVGGYHLIWPRDLYHVALALLKSGDRAAAKRALGFLKRIQYKDGEEPWNLPPRFIYKKGAFPQNTWVTGEDYWGGLQVDQVGYPIHLFYQLYKDASENEKKELVAEFKTMLENAMYFILEYGPWSQQERWEENYGISPSSFSVAASALVLGSRIFDGSELSIRAFETAIQWVGKPGDNIDTWTFTTNGYYGDGRYYLRVAGCSSYGAIWNPNDHSFCHIANSPMKKDLTLILDQGFLKLALLGLKPANDEKIKSSLKVLNDNIRVKTPNGYGWYRYSFDSYGERDDGVYDGFSGKGRLWPLLSGEHGRYVIERYTDKDLNWDEVTNKVDKIIDSYLGFANEGMMIPEQVFEHTGEGTGAATPLAWSHAEYIKLLWSYDLKSNVENVLN